MERGASAHANKGDYDKAIADYDKAIRLTPDNAQWYVFRGTVFLQQGQFGKALADVRAAIKLDPKNDEARSLRDLVNQKTSQIIRDTVTSPLRSTTTPTPAYHFTEPSNGALR